MHGPITRTLDSAVASPSMHRPAATRLSTRRRRQTPQRNVMHVVGIERLPYVTLGIVVLLERPGGRAMLSGNFTPARTSSTVS